MRTSSLVFLGSCALLCACEKQVPTRTADAPAPSASAAAPPPPPPPPTAAPPPPGPPPGTAAVQATGKRSSRASEIIAKCKTPPPTACGTDADCTIFDIDTWDGVCASTLKAGIAASQRASYLASAPCFIPGPAMPPSCVVHWVRAEDGPAQPPPQTVIAAKCINRAGLSQYFARSE